MSVSDFDTSDEDTSNSSLRTIRSIRSVHSLQSSGDQRDKSGETQIIDLVLQLRDTARSLGFDAINTSDATQLFHNWINRPHHHHHH